MLRKMAEWVLGLLVVVVGLGGLPNGSVRPVQAMPLAATGCATGTEDTPAMNAAFEQDIVERVNALRADLELPPMKRQSDLDRAARYHAFDLVQDNYPPRQRPEGHSPHNSHDRVSGEIVKVCTFGERIRKFYANMATGAENLAYGYTTPERAMNGWINSSGHYRNMTSTSSWGIGVGYATSKDTDWIHYWAQNFGRRSGVFPIIINNEAARTTTPNVSLYIYGAGTYTEMRLRNDDGAWGAWQPFQSTLDWTLGNAAGERTVHVELRNTRGTVSSSDTITLDVGELPTSSPTVTPTDGPSEPTVAPTDGPSEPTVAPTDGPSEPTVTPTDGPSDPTATAAPTRPTATPTITPTPQPEPTLRMSHASGAPGSVFALRVQHFPPNTTVQLLLNGHEVITGTTNAQGELMLRLETGEADQGIYSVEVRTADGDIVQHTHFTLAATQPKRTLENGEIGDVVLVPEGIANDLPKVYLPFVRRAPATVPSPLPTITTPTTPPTTPTTPPTGSTVTPTNAPTDPTVTPTDAPTDPTVTPTDAPTDPTVTPTDAPTDPTVTPTDAPTDPTVTPTAGSGGGTLNMQDRASVQAFYAAEYSPAAPDYGWTGDIAACNAGDTSAAFKSAVLRRVNFYRAMAGIPANITFTDVFNRKAQQAALMMAAERSLSHFPPETWACYTAEGREAAENSNLHMAIPSSGVRAIDSYIKDSGAGNDAVGHRRWIFFPQTLTMGTGDVPSIARRWGANALWVFGERSRTRTARDEFVAWPPPGFVPYQIVYPRWSFSYPRANFANATVSMQGNGQAVELRQEQVQNGFGEPTIVWIPLGLSDRASWPQPDADTTYTVTISNVVIGGEARNFTYTVTVFAP